MPRDYAKKSKGKKRRRGASRSASQPAVPLSLWIFTGVIVLAFSGGLVYLKWSKQAPQQIISKDVAPQQPQLTTSSSSSNGETASNLDEVDEVPFYHVHEELTKKKVNIPKEDLKPPASIKNYYYTMPCGSFRSLARAEELKALIGLSGNTSSIIKVKWQGEDWHRVQLGPFNGRRTAENTRHRLQDNGIHDCKINKHIKK